MKELPSCFQMPNLCKVQALLPLILVGELLALVFCLARQSLKLFDWHLFALISMEILWIVMIGAALLCRLQPLLQRVSASIGAMLCYVMLLLITALVAGCGQILLNLLDGDAPYDYLQVIQHIAISAIITGMVLRYFYLQQQVYSQQQMRLQAEMQARFQALQSRIRPHFLFNSMNIIASLIASDPVAAEQVVEDLSVLFRASLSDAQDVVTLASETSLCQHYIHIEQMRLGERLTVRWHKNLKSEQHTVPLLCLQPLLENAIYHGIQPLLEGGVIDITLDDHNGILTMRVDNPCLPFDALQKPHSRSNGMALANLEQRLRARYGEKSTFYAAHEGAYFCVLISIPTHSDNEK